jgi:WD40 repeat protein
MSVLTERASVALDTYVVDIAWAQDGRALAVAGGEGGVVLVEDVAAKPRARVLGEHAMGTIAVAWQPGTSVVASSGQDSSVVLWDTASRGVQGAEAAATSEPAASSGAQADVSAAGATSGAGVIKRLRPGMGWTEHIAWSPDGKLLAAATGKVLTLWNGAGEPVHKFEPYAATIAALAWDKPGRDVAAAIQGGICVQRIEPPQFTLRRYAWSAACLTAAFSPNGKFLATGTQDGTVHFWNLTTGKDSQMRGYAAKVLQTEWSANGRYLATAAGNDVIVWDFGGKGPEGTRPLELRGHTERVSALAFQPNGTCLVSAGRDWRISLWQPGKETVAVDAHLSAGEISAIRWSPDGKQLAVGETKGRMTLYDFVDRSAPAKKR